MTLNISGKTRAERTQKGRKSVSFCTLLGFRQFQISLLESMAGTTGLEPATSAVTGQHSNQLNYVPNATPAAAFVHYADSWRNSDSVSERI